VGAGRRRQRERHGERARGRAAAGGSGTARPGSPPHHRLRHVGRRGVGTRRVHRVGRARGGAAVA
jgi:hypothetical protein